MKKLLIPAMLFLAFVASGFAVAYELKNTTAEVETAQGLAIFYRCTPVKEYTYLGTYEVKLIWDDKPALLFDKIIKKVKDKYPGAQAIILNNDMDQAQAIVFK
jgi:hypothetical protein